MHKTRHRHLKQAILRDLSQKMVFIGGPRQVGKTTLSREIIAPHFPTHQYYNWDSMQDRQSIRKEHLSDAQKIKTPKVLSIKKLKTTNRKINSAQSRIYFAFANQVPSEKPCCLLKASIKRR